MLLRSIVFGSIFAIVGAPASADSSDSVPPCSDRTASYAVHAFNFFVEERRSRDSPNGEDFGDLNIFRSTINIATVDEEPCDLTNTDFTQAADIVVVLLSEPDIHALAAAGGTHRYFWIHKVVDRGDGEFRLFVSDMFIDFRGTGFSQLGCMYEILVVDTNDDGEPETVGRPGGRQGAVCK